MKVLVVCVPAAGHVNPLLPVVRALLSQGERVVVASGIDPGGAVQRSGGEFRCAGHEEMDWYGTLQARTRGAPGDGLPPERINHYFLPRLFGEVGAVDMIDDLLSAGRELEPDLVLYETYALAGPLAADVLGVPAVHHLIGPMLPDEVLDLANDAVSPLWRSFGRDAPGYAGVYSGTTIEVTPPSLEALDLPSGERLALRPAPLPKQEATRSDPPVIYATLGTFFGSNLDVFRIVLEGLASEPIDVVATLGTDQDPAALGSVPSNARVERFIPQGDILPGCSAVVHHGGSGTMFGSLAHGLPQVVIPQGADNFINGELLSRASAGTMIGPAELTPERLRDAVRLVLDDPAFTAVARGIASELAAMPAPDQVARSLGARFGR